MAHIAPNVMVQTLKGNPTGKHRFLMAAGQRRHMMCFCQSKS
jgi:hypothetical protein